MKDEFEERIKQAEIKFEKILSEKHPISRKKKRKLSNSIDRDSLKIFKEMDEKTRKLEDSMNRFLERLD